LVRTPRRKIAAKGIARIISTAAMKILIVEDQPDVRATLKDILEINGHEVLAAEDGVEGVKLAAQAPDFIFCDVQMPGLDGHGVLAAVKQMPGVRDVPFVFLTARAQRAQQREGMAAGVDDYITKPFSERDILDAIAARTERHRGVRAQVEQLAERHRREVNAHWSHELLTPLNAVMGSLQLLDLEVDTINRDELKEMLALIREGAERQERLARKLICYFNLEQMLQAPPSGRRSCCQAASAIRAGAARADRQKNLEGELTLSTAPGEVAIDEELLAFAIGEVVSNALNFSAPRGPVVVTGTNCDGRYRIEIADQGQGLTAEQRASIGAFIQFDRNAREQQGLGLGLAIARATATLSGGQVTLEAGPGGRGLNVIFNLPLVTREG
jgi:two-component system sensor histidine kinase/response regulator